MLKGDLYYPDNNLSSLHIKFYTIGQEFMYCPKSADHNNTPLLVLTRDDGTVYLYFSVFLEQVSLQNKVINYSKLSNICSTFITARV